MTATTVRKTSGTISYLEHEGNGDTRTPLVFLHGVFDSARCWEGVIGLLPTDRRMIAIDVRAHGKTPLSDDDFRLPTLGADIVHVIDDVVQGPVLLTGHSMGGIIAQQVAIDRPDLVARLVLEDPGWIAGTSTQDGLEAPPGVVARAKQIETWSDEQLLAQGHRDHPRWHQDEFDSWFEAKRDVDLRFVDGPQDWRGSTGVEACDRITMPTLLVTGDPALGALVTPQQAQRAHELLPDGSRIGRLDGCAHDIRKDDREGYVNLISPFLFG